MPRSPVSISLFALLLLPAAGSAQESDDPIGSCEEALLGYGGASATDGENWILRLPETSGGGALLYIGAVHSRDPGHAQVARIAEAWDEFGPTVALYEGPDRGYADSMAETVAAGGESALVRYLAQRDGVTLGRLEPSPVDEAEFVLERFPADQVKLFYVLREASRLREREGLGTPAIRERIAELLERARALGSIGDTITSLDELETAYEGYWSSPENWWEAPGVWFDPLVSSDQTGGLFTNEINARSSHFRNVHMFRVLAGAALRGERAFAVVGRNHVPMQAPALRCALA